MRTTRTVPGPHAIAANSTNGRKKSSLRLRSAVRPVYAVCLSLTVTDSSPTPCGGPIRPPVHQRPCRLREDPHDCYLRMVARSRATWFMLGCLAVHFHPCCVRQTRKPPYPYAIRGKACGRYDFHSAHFPELAQEFLSEYGTWLTIIPPLSLSMLGSSLPPHFVGPGECEIDPALPHPAYLELCRAQAGLGSAHHWPLHPRIAVPSP